MFLLYKHTFLNSETSRVVEISLAYLRMLVIKYRTSLWNLFFSGRNEILSYQNKNMHKKRKRLSWPILTQVKINGESSHYYKWCNLSDNFLSVKKPFPNN